MGAEYVSDATRKTLEQFGWNTGDPIPENMGEIFADLLTRVGTSKVAGLYLDINSLSAADVDIVKAALAAAKTGKSVAVDEIKATAENIAMDESTRILLAKLAAQKADAAEAVQIVDDRSEIETDTADAAPADDDKSDAPIKSELPEAPSTLDAPAIEPFCPRCNWDMRLKFEEEVTQNDKEAFVAITLGGTRFEKTYELFDGQYSVRFRSLYADENSEIHHQLLIDQRAGDFLNDTEWFLRFFEYRLACSISRIVIKNKPEIIVRELADVKDAVLPNEINTGSGPELTPLVRLRKYVLSSTLKNEITRRIVGNQFRQFQRLYETMEAMALEPNFWKGIA
jgi:hypothetical protein